MWRGEGVFISNWVGRGITNTVGWSGSLKHSTLKWILPPPPQELHELDVFLQDLQTPTTPTTPGDNTDSDYYFTPTNIQTRDESQNALCFLSVQQMSKLFKQINACRRCSTPGCRGTLVATSISRAGLGGAAKFTYNCNGCLEQEIVFNTVGETSEISRALQVAFIISGCTYTTYIKVMRHSLGIATKEHKDFMDTIRFMYPVVKEMVDDACTEGKEAMKRLEPEEWGSWEKAITVADGTWMTRGFHSKNFTFSIRNYKTGALLFRTHLCQKGQDKLIEEELYQGSSKGAEGYAARKLFQQAKEEGMNVALNWQDDDSSTSKAIKEVFPQAEVLLCRGHEGRSHWKQLKELQKMKKFSETWIKQKEKLIKDIPHNICCKCTKRHKRSCGCFTQDFIDHSRNLFSHIISTSDSSKSCAKRIRSLYKHATNDHSDCDFHSLVVCTCGNCPDKDNITCKGRPYCSRYQLTCNFHKLAYRVEIEHRASKASKLIHDELKTPGHTHVMEASHNILIRFRSKHIALERLHYHLSTDLGLLQANLSVARKSKGKEYHWIPELYKRLGLPLFEGIQKALYVYGLQRDRNLQKCRTEESKKKRIAWKVKRKLESKQRSEWSKRHGNDTYGKEKKPRTRPCKCGSTEHSKITHRDCPRNKKNRELNHSDGPSRSVLV